MDFQEILVSEKGESYQGGPYGLDYEKTVLALSENGRWLYCGYGGPCSRWKHQGDSGELGADPGPDIFEIPYTEVYKLLCEAERLDLIEAYFPECPIEA